MSPIYCWYWPRGPFIICSIGFWNAFSILRAHSKLYSNSTKKELHALQGLGKHKTMLLAFIFGWNSLLDSRWQSREQGSSLSIMNLHSPDVPCCWEHLIASDFQAQQSGNWRTDCLQSRLFEKVWQWQNQVYQTYSMLHPTYSMLHPTGYSLIQIMINFFSYYTNFCAYIYSNHLSKII